MLFLDECHPVAQGALPGAVGMNDAYAAVSATTTVAVRATAYTEPASANNIELVSSSASDSSASTGARTVAVTYYRNDGTGPYVATVVMNGTTAVAIGDANARFVERMDLVTVGSNATNVGTLTLRLNGGGATVGTIAVSDGRTFWCHHYIAAGRIGYVSNLILGVETVAGADFFLKAQQPLVSNSMENQITCRYRVLAGNSIIVPLGRPGIVIPSASSLTRVVLYTAPDAVTAGTVHGTLTFLDLP